MSLEYALLRVGIIILDDDSLHSYLFARTKSELAAHIFLYILTRQCHRLQFDEVHGSPLRGSRDWSGGLQAMY